MVERERYVYDLYGWNPLTGEYQKWMAYAELEKVFAAIKKVEQSDRYFRFKVNKVRVMG